MIILLHDNRVHKYDDEDSEHYYEIPMEINTAYGPIKSKILYMHSVYTHILISCRYI